MTSRKPVAPAPEPQPIRPKMTIRAAILALSLALAGAPAGADGVRTGPETGLPLPRYVSLNTDRANVRRGPGLSHRIDWVFVRRGAPLQVVAEHGHWRRVRDQDDVGGWIHHALLRGARTAVVTATPEALLREEPEPDAPLVARAETGAIGRLEACQAVWCLLEADGVEGWIEKRAIWGATPEERFD